MHGRAVKMSEERTTGPQRPTTNTNSSISDIFSERSEDAEGPKPYQDPEVLRELYHEREWSQSQIADALNTSQQTISRWMSKLGIEARPPMDQRSLSLSKTHLPKDKIQFFVPNGGGERETLTRHDLVVLLDTEDDGDGWKYSPSEVFGADTHHRFGAPVAIDIPVNLNVLERADHLQEHERDSTERVEEVLGEMFEDYDGEPDPDELENPYAAKIDNDREKLERLRGWSGRVSASDD